MRVELGVNEKFLLLMLVHYAIDNWDEVERQHAALGGDRAILDGLRDKLAREPYKCPAVMNHGPGSQSRTPCERTDPHGLDDEHYAEDPMSPGFEWTGKDGWDRR